MAGCYQNGQRFAFRQNEYILRTSSINGGGTDGKYNERYIVYLTIELTVGIVGIVVTIISIIVTVISILQNETDRRSRHQKSNRPLPKEQVAFLTNNQKLRRTVALRQHLLMNLSQHSVFHSSIIFCIQIFTVLQFKI